MSSKNFFRYASPRASRAFFSVSLSFFSLVSLLLLGLGLPKPATAQTTWNYLNSNTPAAIRCITRSNGNLLGGRASDRIEVWASSNAGTTWTRVGTVAGPTSGVAYGDPDFLSDGSGEVFCAFRQHQGSLWQVTVCRSEDGGATWVYDSTVASTSDGRFIGAPYLWLSRNGTLQCYYDSEEAAANAGQGGFQWINEAARPQHANGQSWSNVGVASRPANGSTLARDGLSSVVNLNGSDMMLVCEGVDPTHSGVNCLYSTLSHDNGQTWDYSSRQKIWAPVKNGTTFNAYCPQAIRYGGGPVGVVFCTDDDFASPSPNNAAPSQRSAHVKFIRTLSTFQQWGDLQTIDASQNSMYAPGMFETSSNKIVCTIDFYNGRQVVKTNAGTP